MSQHQTRMEEEFWTRVETVEDFVARFADQRLSGDESTFMIHSSGLLSGDISGQELSGEWYWEDALFWRRATLGGEDLGWDSEVIERSGRRMRYVREAGRGAASIVTL